MRVLQRSRDSGRTPAPPAQARELAGERDGLALQLSAVPLADLARETRRRGFDLLPAGAFREATSDLERENERLREQVADAERKAGASFNLGLAQVARATDAELESSRLAAVAMSDTIAAIESTDPDESE